MTFKTKEELAKCAIRCFLDQGELPSVAGTEVPEEWRAEGASFVTLHLNKQLRGCIGSPEANTVLYKDVIKNAVLAAFYDSRFLPLTKEEFPGVEIEVSVLTPLKEYSPADTSELLKFLGSNKPGLVIQLNENRALFLPQVWEELNRPEDFLSQLCMKAGLPSDAWSAENLKYWTFSLKG